MRFFSALFSLLAVATTAVVAQSANLGAPAEFTEVSAGSNFNVMVSRPDTLTGSLEIALVIALLTCPNNECPGPSEELGTILYNGSFNPQFSTVPGTGSLPPHQNFTLQVPASFSKGDASLGVAHFALVGASMGPFLETFNSTIVVT